MKVDSAFRGLILCLAVCLLAPPRAYSQTVQVAQRTVNKNIVSSGINKVVIGSEKADIIVEAWSREEIQVRVVLSARHADKAVTLRDLGKMELVVNQDKKVLYLRDFVLLKGKKGKPESNLKASYTVFAPADIALDIQSAFGEVILKGFNSRVMLKSDFCDVRLSHLNGITQLNTSFGKLEAQDLSGSLALSANHTQVMLRRLQGKVRLGTSYGSLQIEPGLNLTSLNLNLKKTTVDFVCREWQKYSYAITGSYTRFKLPEGFRVLSGPEDRQDVSYAGGAGVVVRVQAEFGDFSIR